MPFAAWSLPLTGWNGFIRLYLQLSVSTSCLSVMASKYARSPPRARRRYHLRWGVNPKVHTRSNAHSLIKLRSWVYESMRLWLWGLSLTPLPPAHGSTVTAIQSWLRCLEVKWQVVIESPHLSVAGLMWWLVRHHVRLRMINSSLHTQHTFANRA